MTEQIEIKRKIFDVIETISEKTKKVIRKNKIYFLKDFKNDSKSFSKYIDGNHKCSINGIRVPKIFLFDKNYNIVVEEFVEHKNVFNLLCENDLDEKIFELVCNMNYLAKRGKISIDFNPENFGFDGEKLYYFPCICYEYNEKNNFEKDHYFKWFYSEDFIQILINKGLDIDQKRAKQNKGELNKKIALMIVKYYK